MLLEGLLVFFFFLSLISSLMPLVKPRDPLSRDCREHAFSLHG